MKAKITHFFIIFILLYFNSIFGQNCGTTMANSPVLPYLVPDNFRFSAVQDQKCINVFFHVVRNSNGSNAFTNPNTDNVINNYLNPYFESHYIKFNNLGVNFINNSNYLSLNTEQSFEDIGDEHFNENAINIYITETLNAGQWSGVVIGGLPNKRMFVDIDNLYETTTPHEMGHALGLFHTHETERFGAENIDGSNCLTAGDKICDTPADPDLRNKVDPSCIYTWGNGYTPLTDNIMSYSRAQCRDNFTEGQFASIDNVFSNYYFLQDVINTDFSCAEISNIDRLCSSEQKTISLLYVNSSSSTSWSSSSNVQIVSNDNNSVTVEPEPNSNPGNGWVKATLNNGTILQEDFWVGEPKLLTANLQNGDYLSHGYVNTVCKSELIKTDITLSGAKTVSWSLVSSSHTTTWSQSSNNLTFYLWASPNHTATFKLLLNSECGTLVKYYAFKSENCTGGDDPCGPTMEITQTVVDSDIEIINIPAPCDPVISRSLKVENSFNNATATLYDISGNTVVNNTSFHGKMNVDNVKPGLYLLIVKNNGIIKNFRVVIE